MIRKVIILSIGFFFALTALGKESADTIANQLYREYYRLLDTDQKEEFYRVSRQLQQVQRERGMLNEYYTTRQNEILYDTKHGEIYKAITKANDMKEDMQADGVNMYDYVYLSLGELFESRGNYRMSMHYYEEALKSVPANDTVRLSHVYAKIVSVNIANYPQKAWEWNERLASIQMPQDDLYIVYLVMKGQICFFLGDKEKFFEAKREYDEVLKYIKSGYNYGKYVLSVMEKAFFGKYDEALNMLERDSQDYDAVQRCDIRRKIYEMMGLYEMALQEENKRRDIRDSLTNELLFKNINEANSAAGINALREKAAKEQNMWLTTIILLLFIAVGRIISHYTSHRRYQKALLKQNEELEIALDEAKESDRMKNIFIKHVSNEIRPPLNVITGYAQIIAQPDFEEGMYNSEMIIKTIEQNTVAITDIVNELLEMSQEESKKRYRLDDEIAVNDFCRGIMKDLETKNDKNLTLSFKTSLPNDFTMLSNQDGIERILQQVLENALKFTEQGEVELSVYKDNDDSNMYFAVTDTGIGIPKEQQEQVFKHFYKVDSFKQGLGVGLSTSRKTAVRLGGSLVIDKEYTNGTRMILSIPIAIKD